MGAGERMTEARSAGGLERAAAAALRAGLAPLRHVASTGSTNDDLADEARRGLVDACVLVADHQTAGKGRLGRRWSDAGGAAGPGGRVRGAGQSGSSRRGARSSGSGSLLVSFRLPCSAGTAVGQAAAVSAAALSAVRAVLPAGAAVLSKWPNDLLVESPRASGKLAGVLAEMVDGPRPVAVVGLGLNLAPVPAEPSAAGLHQLGSSIARDELLSRILDELPRCLADPDRSREALRSASATVGRRVRVDYADGTSMMGMARDIDARHRLVVETSAGTRLVETAEVHHLRAVG